MQYASSAPAFDRILYGMSPKSHSCLSIQVGHHSSLACVTGWRRSCRSWRPKGELLSSRSSPQPTTSSVGTLSGSVSYAAIQPRNPHHNHGMVSLPLPSLLVGVLDNALRGWGNQSPGLELLPQRAGLKHSQTCLRWPDSPGGTMLSAPVDGGCTNR